MDVPCVDAGEGWLSTGDFCAHGMELPGDDPVSCALSTLGDPCVTCLDAVDGAAGCMGLNVELDLLGTKPDVVGIGE